MKLINLNPKWYSVFSGDSRHGFTFDCPCCNGNRRLAIAVHVDGTNFDPEPDNPQCFAAGETVWSITNGNDFSDISISPSIDASKYKHWHGFIINGEIR